MKKNVEFDRKALFAEKKYISKKTGYTREIRNALKFDHPNEADSWINGIREKYNARCERIVD